MVDFIIGVLLVIAGITHLYFFVKGRWGNFSDGWNLMMILKGLTGGVSMIALGILLIIRNSPF